MSMLLQVHTIYLFIVNVTPLPKFGGVQYDLPSIESNNVFSSEISDGYLRNDEDQILDSSNVNGNTPKCNGYEYDGTKCKEVNGRILCGYNKNIENSDNINIIVDLGNGCVSRNGRIECGYQIKPFDTNARRPSVERSAKPQQNIISSTITIPTRTGIISTHSSMTLTAPLNKTNKTATNKFNDTQTDDNKDFITKIKKIYTVSEPTLSTAEEMSISIETLREIKHAQETQDPDKENAEESDFLTNETPSIEIVNLKDNEGAATDTETNKKETTYKLISEAVTASTKSTTKSCITRRKDTSSNAPNNASTKTFKTACVEKGDRVICYDLKGFFAK